MTSFEVLKRAVEWWLHEGMKQFYGAPGWLFAARELLEHPSAEQQGIAACMRLNAELRKQLAHYEWRPICEIHEDCGVCVLVNINDPGYMELGSNISEDFDEEQWTHFAEVPKLSNGDADRLTAQMCAPKEETKAEF